MEATAEPIVLTEEKLETYESEPVKLILHNDDFNSFEHVIGCMMLYLMKSGVEAMQIASEVHFSGSCVILGAKTKSELEPIYDVLLQNGLTVSIES